MKNRTQITFFVLIFTFCAAACSILKREDPEKKIRRFLTEFETSLHGDDVGIMALFTTTQSKEAIISAIRVLQNRDQAGVKCSSNFDQATISIEDRGIRIEIPATISADTLEVSQSVQTALILWVKPEKNSFSISEIEGTEFYNQYSNVKYYLSEATMQSDLLEHHKKYIETARRLGQTYDSVVWVTNYAGSDYYYVVKGRWSPPENGMSGGDYDMGLVDEDGKVIVPLENNLVGTIGFDIANVVEVRRAGYVGYYDLEGRSIIPAEYDWIVPYEEGTAFAIVKKDTLYGWFNDKYQFKAGFPTEEARKHVMEFKYLPDNLTLNSDGTSLCEIPAEDGFGSGILMPPSYLTSGGYFKEVLQGFSMKNGSWRGNTESVAIAHTFFDKIADQFSLLIVTITERYVDGRSSFYQNREASFVTNDGQLAASASNLISDQLTFTMIDSTTLEIRAENLTDGSDFFGEGDGGEGEVSEDEINRPQFVYYSTDGALTPKVSNRQFPCTEFAYLNESYVTGSFLYYSNASKGFETRTILSDETLKLMRNEILASYGYIFPDEETRHAFSYCKWYQPHHSSVSEFENEMTEIDRQNLKFLEKYLGPISKDPA
jgi:hypothetical protein